MGPYFMIISSLLRIRSPLSRFSLFSHSPINDNSFDTTTDPIELVDITSPKTIVEKGHIYFVATRKNYLSVLLIIII